ncbi:MAG: RDD family protein [Candidatus Kapabacteria bacterium]|nr:RDD family protein [Candidatus Kapabacteria bacterium]
MDNLSERMENLSIGTAQNVDIEYEIASVGDRIFAILIDTFVLYGYILSYVLIARFFGDDTEDLMFSTTMVTVFILLPLFLYHALFEIFNNGQSVGKMMRKIKVVMLDGSQPTIGAYLLRWLLGIIEISISSGSVALLTMMLNRNGQRIGDIAAGTTVVKLRTDATLGDTIFQKLNSNHIPNFVEAQFLHDEDARLIRDVMNSYYYPNSNRAKLDVIAENLSVYLQRKLNMETSMPPISFLDTLLRDYNHFHGAEI